MTLADVLTWSYGISGTLATGLYLPQIWKLIHEQEARRSMSLLTWFGWSLLGFVSLLYAVVVVADAAMILVTGLNAVFQCIVAALALCQWAADRRTNRDQDIKIFGEA